MANDLLNKLEALRNLIYLLKEDNRNAEQVRIYAQLADQIAHSMMKIVLAGDSR